MTSGNTNHIRIDPL